jgi:uncharacterized protein involved in outer membrane biogenesis
MLRLLKFLFTALVVLIGIVVVALGGLLLVPDDTYRGWVVSAVESTTGRELKIDGGFALHVGQSIELEVGNVRLANAKWASEPALFSADRLLADLSLKSLLQGIVEISLVADAPRVSLETDAAGRGNWEMGDGTPEDNPRVDSGGGNLNLTVLPTLKISQGRFVFANGVNGRREQVDVARFDLGPNEQQLRVALEGQYNDQPVRVSGELGEPRVILRGDQTETGMTVRLGANELSWEGTYSNLLAKAGPTVDITLSMAAPSTHDLEPFAVGASVPDLGKLDIAARLKGSAGSYAAEDLRLELAGSVENIPDQGLAADGQGDENEDSPSDAQIAGDEISVSISGRIADIIAASGIDLNLHALAPSLSQFSALAGTKLPETTPVTFNGKATVGESPQRTANIATEIASEWLNGNIDANIPDIQTAALSGNIALQLESLTTLSDLVGRELPDMGPVKVTAKVASREDSYALTDLDLGFADDALNLQLTGSVADLLAAHGIDLALEGDVSSLAGLSALAGTDLPDTPAVTIQATVSAESAGEGPTKFTATAGTADVEARLEGAIPDILKADELQLKLVFNAKSLADVGHLTGTELIELSPVRATADLSASAQSIDLSMLDLALGKSDLTGSLAVNLPGEGTRGSAKGRFASKVLNLREFGASADEPAPAETAPAEGEVTLPGIESDADGTEQASPAEDPALSEKPAVDEDVALAGVEGDADGTKQTSPKETAQRVFSDAPLPVEFLNAYDADIELSAQEMHLKNVTVDDGTTRIWLNDGALDIDMLNATVGGEPITIAFKLDAGKDPISLDFEINADGVPVSGVLSETSLLQGGLILVDIDIDGQGNSVRDIMAGLDGHASLALKDSRFADRWLSRFGGDLLNQLNPLAANRGYAEIECAALGFDIDNGLATTPRGFVSRETEATWIGQGEMNLKTEEIDFRLQSKPRKGLGISVGEIASLIRFGGTLSDPTLELDPEGVAYKSAEAALAVGTMGASVLVKGLINRSESEEGLCEDIVDTIIAGKNPGEGLEQAATEDAEQAATGDEDADAREPTKKDSGSASPSTPAQSSTTPEPAAPSEDITGVSPGETAKQAATGDTDARESTQSDSSAADSSPPAQSSSAPEPGVFDEDSGN